MARKKRDNLASGGMQFGSEKSLVQEIEEAAFPSTVRPAEEEDELLKQLSNKPFRRVIKAAGGRIQRGNFVLTMSGLEYDGDELTFDEWQDMGLWLTKLHDSIQWMIGDWVNMAEEYIHAWLPEEVRVELENQGFDVPEGKYRWIAGLVDYRYGTLRNFAYIANCFPVSRRRDTLTYSHHVEVASIENVIQQDEFLTLAEAGVEDGKRMSVRELRELVQNYQREQGLLPPPPIIPQEPPLASPLTVGLEKIRQQLDPKRWKNVPGSERKRVFNELKGILQQMENLGFD